MTIKISWVLFCFLISFLSFIWSSPYCRASNNQEICSFSQVGSRQFLKNLWSFSIDCYNMLLFYIYCWIMVFSCVLGNNAIVLQLVVPDEYYCVHLCNEANYHSLHVYIWMFGFFPSWIKDFFFKAITTKLWDFFLELLWNTYKCLGEKKMKMVQLNQCLTERNQKKRRRRNPHI